ncbi:MAG: DUF1573 domain-containing protein [Planctomycetaceae bacterium]|jgi:hypothetical protein|nr:DUF1573 domain-containing protein [Planctomycetaceae bacterium]
MSRNNFIKVIFVLLVTEIWVCGCYEKQQNANISHVNNIKQENLALICKEPVWNIGEIDTTNGISLQHEFQLENRSSEIIRIDKVDSTCGCLVTDDFDKVIHPGDTTNIKCTITLPPFPGQIQKHLFVQAFGEKPMSVQLSIVAIAALNSMLHTFPEKVDFGTIKPGDKQVREVIVQRYDNTPVQYQDIIDLANTPEMTVKEVNKEFSKVKLELTLNSMNLLLGDYQTTIQIRTKHEKYSILELPVRASIQDEDSVFLPLIFIDKLSNNETKTISIWRQDANREGIVIKKILYEGDDFLKINDEKDYLLKDGVVSMIRKAELDTAKIVRGKMKIVFQKNGKEESTYVKVTAFLPAM